MYCVGGAKKALDVIYKDDELKEFCHNKKKAARKLAGFADDLLAKINLIEEADSFNDIMSYLPFHCHQLGKKQKDYTNFWGLDVKGRKTAWRIIVAPLDHNERIIVPDADFCKICKTIKIIRIEEVSKHYE